MLIECHQHLHPLVRLDRNFVGKDIFDQDCSLDTFEQIINTSCELVEEFVKKKLLIFKTYQLEQWWQKHETIFLTIRFLAQQILGIVGSQIKRKRIFSLVGNTY